MSATSASEMSDYHRVIRSLQLKLELLEYGLALPQDEDAIARTRALLEKARSRFLKPGQSYRSKENRSEAKRHHGAGALLESQQNFLSTPE